MINNNIRLEKGKPLLSLFMMVLGLVLLCTACRGLVKDPNVSKNNAVSPQIIRTEYLPTPTSLVGELADEIAAQEAIVVERAPQNPEAMFERFVERRTSTHPHSDNLHTRGIGKDEPSGIHQAQCPVCLLWFDKHEEVAATYWSCHFICKDCGEQMQNKGNNMDCPLCRTKPK